MILSTIRHAVIPALFALGALRLAAADKPADYTPREGDFVFQSLAHGELIDAIEGASESPYSHVGLVIQKGGTWHVREALGPVHDTPLQNWISRGRDNGAFDAYRLKAPYRKHIPAMLRQSADFLGRPYDIHYAMDDEKIYCSELLYKAMLNASGEKIGRLQKLGDLKWRPYAETIEKIEGGPVPLDREMITPRALAEASQLERVYTGYAPRTAGLDNAANPDDLRGLGQKLDALIPLLCAGVAEEHRESRHVAFAQVTGESPRDALVCFSIEGFGGGNHHREYLAVFEYTRDINRKGKVEPEYRLVALRTIGARGWRMMDFPSVTCDSGQITLRGRAYGNNDSQAAPSIPIRVSYPILPTERFDESPAGSSQQDVLR